MPLVVQDEDAKKDDYDISLLKRLSEGASGAKIPEVNLLTTQYRSNRAVAAWSSAYFYRGLVESHPSVAKGGCWICPQWRRSSGGQICHCCLWTLGAGK